MRRTTTILLTLLVLVAAGAAVVVLRQGRPSERRLRFAYNTGSLSHAPVALADARGLFRANGVEVELVPLKSGSDVALALASGDADLGSAGVSNLFAPIARGAPIRIIAPLAYGAVHVYVRPDGGIRTLQDLAGHPVGSGQGSPYLHFRIVLLRAGIDASKLTFVDVRGTDRPGALMTARAIDAAVAGESEEALYERLGAIVLPEWNERRIAEMKSQKSTIAVNRTTLGERRDDVERCLRAIAEAQRLIRTEPHAASVDVAAHYGATLQGGASFAPADIEAQWSAQRTTYAVWSDPAQLTELASLAYDVKLAPRALTLDEFFDRTFEPVLAPLQQRTYGT